MNIQLNKTLTNKLGLKMRFFSKGKRGDKIGQIY
ncbi:hypothetical protein M2132_001504 [Dysgonomonas sp. PH5-45]|nr:hypothetical protein [Dysgonomonas sp. PH5-45]MDH6388107.1 hypothetical protein [Dysgonomonas sp. PH5-37]